MDETPQIPAEESLVPMEVAVPPALPPATAKTVTRDSVLDFLAVLGTGAGVILLCTIVIGVVLALTGSDPRDIAGMIASPWVIAGLFLTTQVPLPIFAFRRRRRNREKQRPEIALFGGEAWPAIQKGMLAGLGLIVLSAVYTYTLRQLLGPDAVESQLDFLQDILANKPAVALLMLIIAGVAPVCEELFFRGAIFGSAHAAGSSKAGVAISAILFASAHLSFLLAPFYATFAVVMCWLYARTGTLAAPIAAHATLNGMACLALLSAGGNQV